MFIDIAAWNRDVPLTVFQSIPVEEWHRRLSAGIGGMIVEKSREHGSMMHIPVLGLVENMSYVVCSDCERELCVRPKAMPTKSRPNMESATVANCDRSWSCFGLRFRYELKRSMETGSMDC
jgi:hypothetical protein